MLFNRKIFGALFFFILPLLFVSCGKDIEIVSISCEQPKVEFVINEKFSPGENFSLTIVRDGDFVQTVNAKKCDFIIDGCSAKKLRFKENGEKIVTVKYKNAECNYIVNVHEKPKKNFNPIVAGIILIFIFFIFFCICKRRKTLKYKKYKAKLDSEKNEKEKHNILDINENREILAKCESFYESISKSDDSTGISVNSRNVGHKIAKSVAKNEGFLIGEYEKSPGKILNDRKFIALMPENILKDFKYVIYGGNKAAHAHDEVLEFSEEQKQYLKKDTQSIIDWYRNNYC